MLDFSAWIMKFMINGIFGWYFLYSLSPRFLSLSLSIFASAELVVTNLWNVLAWTLWSWSYAYQMYVRATNQPHKHLCDVFFLFSISYLQFAVDLPVMKLKLNSFKSVINKIECVHLLRRWFIHDKTWMGLGEWANKRMKIWKYMSLI